MIPCSFYQHVSEEKIITLSALLRLFIEQDYFFLTKMVLARY